ncbi:MAG: aldo/keto reductase [Anaerofustis sp.]
MNYNQFPGTNLTVSAMCLGTMTFGGQANEPDGIEMLKYAYDNGITFFDTANIYCKGESEKIVGKALKPIRNHVILATKLGGRMGDGVNAEGLSRYNIIRSVEESLKRLDTDWIDLYYMHVPDERTSYYETMEAMSRLEESGKIRYVGVSNHAAWQIAEMSACCDTHHFCKPIVTQNVYNLLTRGLETELKPYIEKNKIGLAVFNPIAGGLLTGKHHERKPESGSRFATEKGYYDRYFSEKNLDAVERLSRIAEQFGTDLLTLSINWVASKSFVSSSILGCSRLSQLKQNIELFGALEISREIEIACDEIWNDLAGDRFAYCR